MRVIHVVPAITEEASGPSYSVVRLCQSLIETGEEVSLVVLDWAPHPSKPAFTKTFPLGFGPRRLGRSPKMFRWLIDEVKNSGISVLHNHGMWQMNAVYPGKAVKNSMTKLVVSPRGAFSTWAMSHGSKFKRIFWPLIQRPALAQASCFHATSEAEYLDIRRLGFKQPVSIIPNGIDVPELMPKNHNEFRVLLFLGRIHPVKGIDTLLSAWAAVMDRFPDWRLLVVGSDVGYNLRSSYIDQMKAQSTRIKLKRIEFLPPVYGKAKLLTYREADLFVLPSSDSHQRRTMARVTYSQRWLVDRSRC